MEAVTDNAQTVGELADSVYKLLPYIGKVHGADELVYWQLQRLGIPKALANGYVARVLAADPNKQAEIISKISDDIATLVRRMSWDCQHF